MVKDVWFWLKAAQHEWWFLPAALGLVLIFFLIGFLIRLAFTRLVSKITTPRMRAHDDQVLVQWATPDDLETKEFNLVSPKRTFWTWFKSSEIYRARS